MKKEKGRRLERGRKKERGRHRVKESDREEEKNLPIVLVGWRRRRHKG